MGARKSIMLIITYSCNLNCIYCYEPKKVKHRMTLETAKDVILSQFSLLNDECDTVEIHFMGGEPLMEFALIKEISEWLWSTNTKYNLMLFASTNGTLLNEEMRAWFHSNRHRITLGLSFDGNNVMQNINRSKSSSSVDIEFFAKTWPGQNIKMTISPQTLPSLSEGIIYLHNAGFDYISVDLAMGDKVNWNQSALLDYKDELNKLVNYYLANIEKTPCSLLNIDLSEVVKQTFKAKTCSCGEDLVCIDWNGDTYACHLFAPVTLPFDVAQKAKAEIDFTEHEAFQSTTCDKCILSSVCNRCPGMNYICSSNVSTPSAFHCNAFKIGFAASCRFQMLKAQKEEDKGKIELIKRIINLLK